MENDNFFTTLQTAAVDLESKISKEVLEKLKAEINNYYDLFNTFSDFLRNNELLKPDPYTDDTPSSTLELPLNTPISHGKFNEDVGIRFEHYRKQLDLIANGYSYTLDFFSIDRLLLLNKFFDYVTWGDWYDEHAEVFNRLLTRVVIQIKKLPINSMALSVSDECINRLAKTKKIIKKLINDILFLKSQIFKIEIRKQVLPTVNIDIQTVYDDRNEAADAVYQQCQEVYTTNSLAKALIIEVIDEKFSPNSQKLCAELLAKFADYGVIQKNEAIKPDKNEAVQVLKSLSNLIKSTKSALDATILNIKKINAYSDSFMTRFLKIFFPNLADNDSEHSNIYKFLMPNHNDKGETKIELDVNEIVHALKKRYHLYQMLKENELEQNKLSELSYKEFKNFIDFQFKEQKKIVSELLAVDFYYKHKLKDNLKKEMIGYRIICNEINGIIDSCQKIYASYCGNMDKFLEAKKNKQEAATLTPEEENEIVSAINY